MQDEDDRDGVPAGREGGLDLGAVTRRHCEKDYAGELAPASQWRSRLAPQAPSETPPAAGERGRSERSDA